ncbi:hypothetical protein K438DRAFT_1751058 [Mycena galopus ATCC 62051]|nr:hypothetical protein K438DRAFT_1751058 [Mycena galopus ATCC 62051]
MAFLLHLGRPLVPVLGYVSRPPILDQNLSSPTAPAKKSTSFETLVPFQTLHLSGVGERAPQEESFSCAPAGRPTNKDLAAEPRWNSWQTLGIAGVRFFPPPTPARVGHISGRLVGISQGAPSKSELVLGSIHAFWGTGRAAARLLSDCFVILPGILGIGLTLRRRTDTSALIPSGSVSQSPARIKEIFEHSMKRCDVTHVITWNRSRIRRGRDIGRDRSGFGRSAGRERRRGVSKDTRGFGENIEQGGVADGCRAETSWQEQWETGDSGSRLEVQKHNQELVLAACRDGEERPFGAELEQSTVMATHETDSAINGVKYSVT